jgi:hypothetical protein
MSTLGPFDVRAGVMQRATRFMDLIIRNRPGTERYRLWGSDSLVNAYGTLTDSGIAGTGGTALLEAAPGTIAQSTLVVARKWAVSGSRRGQTSFQLDPEDWAGTLPEDDNPWYFRIQERRAGNWMAVPAGGENEGYPIRGPILVVPPPRAYGQPSYMLNLFGTAPTETGCTLGAAPVIDETVQTPLPLQLLLPGPLSSMFIENHSDTHPLLVSYGQGMPMGSIGTEERSNYYAEGVREIFLASGGAAAISFSIEATVKNQS